MPASAGKSNARLQSKYPDLQSSCLQVKAKQEEVDHKEELLAVLMERFGDSDLHPQVWVLLQLNFSPPGLPCPTAWSGSSLLSTRCSFAVPDSMLRLQLTHTTDLALHVAV